MNKGLKTGLIIGAVVVVLVMLFAGSYNGLIGKEEEVDSKLKTIMIQIFQSLDEASRKYGLDGNYVAGANIAGFLKVSTAMKEQGIV